MIGMVSWACIVFSAASCVLCTWAAPAPRIHWTGIASLVGVAALAFDWTSSAAAGLLAAIFGLTYLSSSLILRRGLRLEGDR